MATSQSGSCPCPNSYSRGKDGLSFDLQGVYRSVLLLHTEASKDGYTAATLGTERLGHGRGGSQRRDASWC